MKKQLTLCLIRQNGKMLLGMKKRGFGAGVWNGFGGKLEPGETVEAAAKRELWEESGIEAKSMEKRGVIDFEFQNDPKIMEVHIFEVTNFAGEPKETEEMRPEWFAENQIPFSAMWPDDVFWVPLFLARKQFTGKFLFDRPSDPTYTAKIISQELHEI